MSLRTGPEPGTGTADTNGWDTVSAVRVGDMNRTIAQAGTSPKDFLQAVDGIEVSGRFGDWWIAPGGDGGIIHMALPMDDLVVRQGGETTVLGAAEAEVALRLAFLPHDVDRAADDGRMLLKLMVDARNARAVSVLEVDYPVKPPLFLRSAVFAALDAWLSANLQQFRHVFACVAIDRAVATDDYPWLKPSYVSYAFAARTDAPGQSQFGILCRTAGRGAEGLIEEIGPHVIPPGQDAAFLISSVRFARDMLAPAVRRTFLSGTSEEPPRVEVCDTGIVFHGAVRLDTVDADGKSWEPVLESLTAQLHTTSLHMETLTRTYVSPGIWSMTSCKSNYGFGLARNRKQEKTLGFQPLGEAETSSWPRHDQGIVIIEAILIIIGLIAAALAFWFPPTLLAVPNMVVAIALVGTTGGTIAIHAADMVATGNAPPLSLMLASANGVIEWAQGSIFEPECAALNGALQIGGSLGTTRQGDRLLTSIDAIRAFQARFGAYGEDA